MGSGVSTGSGSGVSGKMGSIGLGNGGVSIGGLLGNSWGTFGISSASKIISLTSLIDSSNLYYSAKPEAPLGTSMLCAKILLIANL